MGINWTPDQKSIVAEKLKEGWGSRAIGELFDRSKNAVIGLVGRDPELKEIGFAREGLGGQEKGWQAGSASASVAQPRHRAATSQANQARG